MKSFFGKPPPSSFDDARQLSAPPSEVEKLPPGLGGLIRSLTGVDPAQVVGMLRDAANNAKAAHDLMREIRDHQIRVEAEQRAEITTLREILRATVPEAHIALSELEREQSLSGDDPGAAERRGALEIARLAEATGQVGGVSLNGGSG